MKGTENEGKTKSTDVLEELFRHASARQQPPAGDEQAIREALHGEWLEMTRRNRRRRIAISALAAAAVIFLAVSLVPVPFEDGAPAGPAPEVP